MPARKRNSVEEHLHEEVEPEHLPDQMDEISNNDTIGKVATIAVVGVGVALVSAELIPGMLIGIAAAFLPGLAPKMRPLLKSGIRAGYSAAKKTREMVAEATEQMQDVMAEARSERAESEAAKTKSTRA
jgi:Protein of unknown function (DUF5132)